MNRVDQQTDTDCLRACVASLLDMTYEDVPDFGLEHGQWLRFERFMALQSVRPIGIPIERFCTPFNAYYLAVGISPRGLRHSCVALNGKIVHDPHPSRAGLDDVQQCILFVAFLANEL